MTATAEGPRLLRSSAVVAAGSLLSRVTGLGRVAAMAWAIGVESRLADSYNAANNLPNIVYELAVGGVLSASLVPLFVERIDLGDREGVSAVASVTIVVLGIVAALGVLAAPAIGAFISLGVGGPGSEGYAEAATRLLRWFMPQVYFYGVLTLITAMLNARRRFTAAAFAPVMNNLVVIVMFLTLPAVAHGDLLGSDPLGVAHDEWRVLLWLGLGTTLGVAASAAVVAPSLADRALGLRFNLDWRNPLIGRLVRLSGWTVGYVAANQLSFVATLLVANRLTRGSIAAFDTAYLLFVVPHGLLAASFMTAVMPELARAVQRGDRRGLRREWAQGLRLVALVMMPASAGLFVLATPVVQVLVRRAEDIELTAGVLRAFAVGLAGFSIYLYSLRPFYAEGDLRTPFRVNVAENALQVVLTIVIGLGLATAPGLALAHSIAYLVAAVGAFAVAARRLGRVPVSWVSPLVTMAFAALAMAVVVAAVLQLADLAGVTLPALAQLVVGVGVGVPTYAAYLYLFGGGAEVQVVTLRLRAALGR